MMNSVSSKQVALWDMMVARMIARLNAQQFRKVEYSIICIEENWFRSHKSLSKPDIPTNAQILSRKAKTMFHGLIKDYVDHCEANNTDAIEKSFGSYLFQETESKLVLLTEALTAEFDILPNAVMTDTLLNEQIRTWLKSEGALKNGYLIVYWWRDPYDDEYMVNVIHLETAMKQYLMSSA